LKLAKERELPLKSVSWWNRRLPRNERENGGGSGGVRPRKLFVGHDFEEKKRVWGKKVRRRHVSLKGGRSSALADGRGKAVRNWLEQRSQRGRIMEKKYCKRRPIAPRTRPISEKRGNAPLGRKPQKEGGSIENTSGSIVRRRTPKKSVSPLTSLTDFLLREGKKRGSQKRV